MASINTRNGKLVIDFRYRGLRCREQTQLADTPHNRKRLTLLANKIEAEITLGCFEYQKYFSQSKLCEKFRAMEHRERASSQYYNAPYSPNLAEFADIWLAEKKIEWSKGHYIDVSGVIEKYLLPAFGNQKISSITKQKILKFRSILSQVPGRKGEYLSSSRINHIMTPLRQLLNEAADRYDFNSPWKNIKALKVSRTVIDPFHLDEVESFLNAVPDAYKTYYTTRFFTGMRTGEIDGLQWKDIDLVNKTIKVKQALSRNELKELKTESSYRDIDLIDRVIDVLQKHKRSKYTTSTFVFINSKGKPFCYPVVSRTIWYPTLDAAGLRHRNPYQTRHTYATLLLASGESPEWIAKQMGHSTTTMLFRVYSRFVPNLTRRDGSAFEKFLNNGGR
ncbi:phage integrase [Photobacterium leiognathi lrivu.4.1]|uniref:Phage integrase n=2 Tax=Photobacterium TaxID=657 RepID=V5F3X8_PHOLE|nr:MULTISPECIES: site-specific integrase [Photobacterium]EAS63280.1 Phage integrase [Vibrio angustum S14] [Photobacterium angustum S14]GAD32150.1 phage integrase [Photobacterium leiognathi lrivu.4.1]